MDIIEKNILLICISFLVSFLITYISIPSIIKVSKLKNLCDLPDDDRRVHKNVTPTLGGIAVFAGFVISLLFFVDSTDFQELKFLLISVIILFFVGIKDDILMIAPWTKMFLQIIAAFILVVFGRVQITDFHGFFNIHEIPQFIGIPFSVLIFIVLINAINFIDGIDGLSATIGIIITSAFGFWFFLIGEYSFVFVAVALVGSLVAFLKFYLFDVENKIFIGDTGTLIMGLVIAFLAIEFNQKNLELEQSSAFYILPAPAVTFGILIIPLFDFLRIIYIRLIIRKPLFSPDKRHLHHLFLNLGFSHIKTVIILGTTNIFFILISFWLSEFVTIKRLLLLLILSIIGLSMLPKFIIDLKNKRNEKKNISK